MMSLTNLLNKIRLSPRDAEVIFDRDEPVGEATDLVLSGRRWFRRDEVAARVSSSRLNDSAPETNRATAS